LLRQWLRSLEGDDESQRRRLFVANVRSLPPRRPFELRAKRSILWISPKELAMPPAYDPDNIFAKILRGEAPSVRIFEDEVSLAFMDVMPRAEGHALCIPKFLARNLFDIPAAELARFMPSVHRLALAVKAGMAAEGISLMQFNESAGGQVVFHLHFHVLPRWTGVALRPPGGPFVPADQLEPIAARIRAAL